MRSSISRYSSKTTYRDDNSTMRFPLALLSCIGFAVLFPKAVFAKTVPFYMYREPPTSSPTSTPSDLPSARPSIAPTDYPSPSPSMHPSFQPTSSPLSSPSYRPSLSLRPSHQPSSSMPPSSTSMPSSSPTSSSQPSLTAQPTTTSLRASNNLANSLFFPSGLGFWLIIGLVSAVGCFLLLDCFGCFWKRKSRHYPDDDESFESE